MKLRLGLGAALAGLCFTAASASNELLNFEKMPTAADFMTTCGANNTSNAAECDAIVGAVILMAAGQNTGEGYSDDEEKHSCVPINKDIKTTANAVQERVLPWLREHETEQSKTFDALKDAISALYPCDLKVMNKMDQEIAATGVAAEAREFIPTIWQSRVRPIRSERLDSHCVYLDEISGTPADADRQAFLYQCRPTQKYSRNIGEDTLYWVAANNLAEVSATKLPDYMWRNNIALRGREPLAYMEGISTAYMSSDGKIKEVKWPGGLTSGFRDIDPLGHNMLRLDGEDFLAFDTSTNTVTFKSEVKAPFYLIRKTAKGVVQLVGGRNNPDCARHMAPALAIITPIDVSCPPEVVVLDANTGDLHRIAIPNGLSGYPESYGERQVFVSVRSSDNRYPPDVAIIDLDELRVVWSGRSIDAPPAKATMCKPLDNVGDTVGFERPALHASLNGAGFILQAAERTAPTRCAITGDGRRLAVVAPPYIHYYSIDR